MFGIILGLCLLIPKKRKKVTRILKDMNLFFSRNSVTPQRTNRYQNYELSIARREYALADGEFIIYDRPNPGFYRQIKSLSLNYYLAGHGAHRGTFWTRGRLPQEFCKPQEKEGSRCFASGLAKP